MLWLAAGGGWCAGCLCAWVAGWYNERRRVRDMGLQDLRALLATIRTELAARGGGQSLANINKAIDREVEQLYDETRDRYSRMADDHEQ